MTKLSAAYTDEELIQWNISPSFDLAVIYVQGITDVRQTRYNYANNIGKTNDMLQFRLSYKLFHKKFSGE